MARGGICRAFSMFKVTSKTAELKCFLLTIRNGKRGHRHFLSVMQKLANRP